MKKPLLWILALAGILIAVVSGLLLNRREAPGRPETTAPTPPPPPPLLYPPASPPPVRKPAAIATPVTVPAPPQPPQPQPQAPAPPAEIPPDEMSRVAAQAANEVETLGLRIREYRQRFDGNPEGTNAEITAALTGGNPKSVRFLDGDLLRLNDEGELVDSWNTPYFFHQLSADEMETRSAGPDRTLWTDDDVVTR